jgi:hypothetical protein
VHGPAPLVYKDLLPPYFPRTHVFSCFIVRKQYLLPYLPPSLFSHQHCIHSTLFNNFDRRFNLSKLCLYYKSAFFKFIGSYTFLPNSNKIP